MTLKRIFIQCDSFIAGKCFLSFQDYFQSNGVFQSSLSIFRGEDFHKLITVFAIIQQNYSIAKLVPKII